MTECSNVEMRERLPDLANESLAPEVQALVLRHVMECAPCTEELQIIRVSRVVLRASAPAVNVEAVVSVLPRYKTRSVSPWRASWRVAAGITLLVGAAGSYTFMNRQGDPLTRGTLAIPADTVGLAMTGALTDLTDGELALIMDGLREIEALPSTDVEPVSMSLLTTPLRGMSDTIMPNPEVF